MNSPPTFSRPARGLRRAALAAALAAFCAGCRSVPPPTVPPEVAATNVVARLAADDKLRKRFEMAYPDGLTENNVLDAFGQYQRTLFSSGLPFDRWCAGRTNALDAVQTKGFGIFRRRKCTDCHYGPALGMLKVADGKKVPGLRGLSQRRAYLPDARVDLGAVLTLMPGGDVDEEERRALTAFLKSL